jgi:hypothetical protein
MLDQSFSAENFRKILDIENRKGVYLEGEFFEDIIEINREIKEINQTIKLLRKQGLSKEDFLEKRSELTLKKEVLKDSKDTVLMRRLRSISSSVTQSNFRLGIDIDWEILGDKPVYKTSRTLENILTLKQLQYNFRKLYKVKQSNRYSIISQLKNILGDGFPKIIVKTDVSSFYESIPHDGLMKKINDENLLTYLSRRFIQQVLIDYEKLSEESIGVPRGIGISPYLVELYMRDIDAKIKNLPNVLYYARYVDDIIVVFSPQVDNSVRNFQQEIKDILISEGLTMNESPTKTKVIRLDNVNTPIQYDFEYLGYKFSSNVENNKQGSLLVSISNRKKEKYSSRLLSAFEGYLYESITNEKIARKIFVKRLRLLMGNTRLVNNKRNVITGVYYSNSLATEVSDFNELDEYFKKLIKDFNLPPGLERRIASKSFVHGFHPTSITKFSGRELGLIMKNWKV